MKMQKRKKVSNLLEDKLLFTFMIFIFYMIGRAIPLCGIDSSSFAVTQMDAKSVLTQTISGDLNQCSILALGITPYMLASIPVMIISSCRSEEAKQRISQIKMNRLILLLMFVLAFLQAFHRVETLEFTSDGTELLVQKCIAVVQMITGAFLIMWLARRNKLYGIGGQTVLIFANMMDGVRMNLAQFTFRELKPVLIYSVLGMFIMLVMENTEKRIPVQRISIHNIYADKNYYAIKFNPIGIMPMMFAMAFFMLPQFLVSLLLRFFPNSYSLNYFQENCDLTKPLGILVYILILFFITVLFSFVFLNPVDTAEQYLKSGDSIENIHAGRATKMYLVKNLLYISIFSATVMSLCVGIPMILQLTGKYNNSLVMIPSSIMMMTGLWTNLYREMECVNNLDSYEVFIKAV